MQEFKHELFGEVRAVKVKEEVWFLGRDIVEVLGYTVSKTTSYTKHINRHIREENTMRLTNQQLTNMGVEKVGRKGEVLLNRLGVITLVENSLLLSSEDKEDIYEWLGINKENHIVLHSRKEVEFFDVLKSQLKVLGVRTFERQYSNLQCGNYRIDMYLPELNIAIEYDEKSHEHYTYEQQELRQKLIEEELGCTFIRVSEEKSHSENSAIVIKHIIKNL